MVPGDFWFVLVFSGGGTIVYGVANLYIGMRTRRWRSVSISVSGCGIGVDEEVGHYGLLRWYRPVVSYSYSVQGEEYASEVVCVDKKSLWCSEESDAKFLLNDILEGGQAYYNPKKPGSSVLVVGLSRRRVSHYLSFVVGGLLVIGVGVVVGL